MKVDFSTELLYTPEWNGNRELEEHERIFATLKPLTLSEMIDLMDVLSYVSNVQGTTNISTADTKKIGELLVSLAPIFEKNVHLQGLEGQKGSLTSTDILQYQYFMDLTTEIMNKLVELSMPSVASEKNLPAPSDA